MSNEKQLTAMSHLRKEIDDRITHAKYSVVSDELKVIRNIIDMVMLQMERQQLIDFHTICCKNGLERENEKYSDEDVDLIKQHANDYYNETFKTQ